MHIVLPQHKEAETLGQAIAFYAQELMPKKKYKHIRIDLTVQDDPEYTGLTWPIDEHPYQHFGMVISPRNKYRTLAHEMIHVKQWVMRELMGLELEINEDLHVYKFWNFKLWEGSDLDSPWEQEAYSMEQELHQRWIEHSKKFKSK